jgi:hypothetical protein
LQFEQLAGASGQVVFKLRLFLAQLLDDIVKTVFGHVLSFTVSKSAKAFSFFFQLFYFNIYIVFIWFWPKKIMPIIAKHLRGKTSKSTLNCIFE